ncbi:hypothetical protein [Mucilaginibacter sp. RCC_168]|uniref:hypothetical protein n=1 Tax=unclassified Mucilaginibacter TaxID=2617802 RepID=UPI0035232B75
MAISDVFLVKAAYTALAKVAVVGIAKLAAEEGTNLVYRGLDPITQEVKYVGITARDFAVREAEHKAAIGTGRELLDYEVVEGATGLSRRGARILEQKLINDYGLDNLLNKINSIAPSKWSLYGITP